MRVSVQLQRLIQKAKGYVALLDVQASRRLDRREHFSAMSDHQEC